MKNRKKRKVAIIILGSLFAIIGVVLIGAWSMFGDILRATSTIEKLEDGLYAMEYTGDYGFEEFLNQGGADSDAQVAAYITEFLSKGFYKAETEITPGEYGCSTICTKNAAGDVLFGRNYDWEEGKAIIVHTKPDNGYESLSTCYLDFLGFEEDYVPDASMLERIMAMAAIYVPLDGMNEKGLMIADLIAGDKEETHQQTDKGNQTTTTAIRLLLDYAADVDEAIALLEQYDMNSSAGSAHHYAIADASGRSVVVEYINNKMYVTETKFVTNHYLTEGEKYGIGSEQSHIRWNTLSQSDGVTDEHGVMEVLKSVAQFRFPQTPGNYEKTVWSIVYNPTAMTADFYFEENYEHCYSLVLQESSYIQNKY